MSWSYSSLLTTATDRVRLLIGDTDAGAPLLSNEEIGAFLPGGPLGEPNELLAAAAASEALANQARRLVDIGEGGANASLSQRAAAFDAQARLLRTRAAREGIAANTAMLPTAADGSLRGPAFTTVLGDRPGAGDRP